VVAILGSDKLIRQIEGSQDTAGWQCHPFNAWISFLKSLETLKRFRMDELVVKVL